MATEGMQITDGGNNVAGVDLSANQFYCVKQSTSTDRMVILANSGGEAIRGVLQNKPKASQATNICTLGITKAIIGATVATGVRLMTDASAKLITATGTNHCVAIAMEAGATNNIITVEVMDRGTIA
jgi:hypothetical protein